jgi:hypothetical protein
MPPIENAYFELKGILKAAHKKAATLRRRAKQANKRRSRKVHFPNSNLPSLAGASNYVPPTVVGANQQYISKMHPNNFETFKPYQPPYQLY